MNGHARPVKNRINIKKECDFVVKREHEQMYFCESLEVTVDRSKQIHKLEKKNKQLKDELQHDQLIWQHTIEKLTARNEEYKHTIRRLTYDNKKLPAQNKQLQSEFNRKGYDAIQKNINGDTSKNVNNKSVVTKQTNENVYEVEQLVSHKTRNGSKHFLIRWKGYDDSFDTWKREENLNCPKLLKKYLQSLK